MLMPQTLQVNYTSEGRSY